MKTRVLTIFKFLLTVAVYQKLCLMVRAQSTEMKKLKPFLLLRLFNVIFVIGMDFLMLYCTT